VQRVWRSRSSPIIWQAKCRRFEEALIATLPPNTPALCYGATTGSTPFPFNLHQGDTGHTMIEGPTRLSPHKESPAGEHGIQTHYRAAAQRAAGK
jgi:hypothetical protein